MVNNSWKACLLVLLIALYTSKGQSQTFTVSFPENLTFCPEENLEINLDTSGLFSEHNSFIVEVIEMYGNKEGVSYKTTESKELSLKFSFPNIEVRKGDSLVIKISSSTSNYCLFSKKINIQYIAQTLNSPQTLFCEGSSITASTLYATVPTSIEWFKNNKAIPNSNKVSLEINENGVYFAEINVKGCSLKTEEKKFKTGNIKKPYILQNTVLYACKGNEVILIKGDDSENDGLAKKWYQNGQLFDNNNSRSIRTKEGGFYKLEVSQGNCKSESDSILVTINENTTVFGLYIRDKRGFKGASGVGWQANDSTFLACKNSPVLLLTPLYGQLNTITTWIINDQEPSNSNYKGADFLYANSEGKYQVKQQQGNCIFYSKPIYIQYTNTLKYKIYEYNVNSQKNLTTYGNIDSWPSNWKKNNLLWFKDNAPILKDSEVIKLTDSGLYHFNMDFNECKIVSDTILVSKMEDFFVVLIDSVEQGEVNRIQLGNDQDMSTKSFRLAKRTKNLIQNSSISVNLVNDYFDEFQVLNSAQRKLQTNDTITYFVKFTPNSLGDKNAKIELSVQPVNPRQLNLIHLPITVNLTATAKDVQEISFDPFQDYTFGETEKLILKGYTKSGLKVKYLSSNLSVALIRGDTLYLLAPGVSTITAFQEGNNNYLSVEKKQVLNVLEPLLLANEKIEPLQIYPNPTKEHLILQGNLTIEKVTIYDSRGIIRKIYEPAINNIISLQDIPKGLYFIRILDTDKNIYTSRFYKSN